MISIKKPWTLPGRSVVYWSGKLQDVPEKGRIAWVRRLQQFEPGGKVTYPTVEHKRTVYPNTEIWIDIPGILRPVQANVAQVFANWTAWYQCIVDYTPWKRLADPMQYVPLVDWPDKSQRIAKVLEDTGMEDLDRLMEALQKLREDFKREEEWPGTLSPGMAMGSCLPCIVSIARKRPDIRRRDGHDMSRLWAILVDGEKEKDMEIELKEVPGYFKEQFSELLAWKLKSEKFDSREKAQDCGKEIDRLKDEIEDYEKEIAEVKNCMENCQKARDEYAARAAYCDQMLVQLGEGK